jgi:hypothetical protein
VSNGQNILKRDFSPGFAWARSKTRALKNLVVVCSHRFRHWALWKKNLAAAVALGFGNENASALIKALEKAGVEVKARRVETMNRNRQSD